MRNVLKIIFLLVLMNKVLLGQSSEIRIRIDVGELKMTFPSIYFKHNSTEYAKMPYSVDSCLKHIATHIKDVSGKPIWRDSLETDQLSNNRIRKIKTELKQYTKQGLAIESMHDKQKISRRTINLGVDSAQIDYLLSLNSVFDIAKTRFPKEQKKQFRVGSAFDAASIKHKRQISKKGRKERHFPRLVWTGWKTGFHWSSVGKTKKNESADKSKIETRKGQSNHGMWILGTCCKCMITDVFREGSWLNKSGRDRCRMDRRRIQMEKAETNKKK